MLHWVVNTFTLKSFDKKDNLFIVLISNKSSYGLSQSIIELMVSRRTKRLLILIARIYALLEFYSSSVLPSINSTPNRATL